MLDQLRGIEMPILIRFADILKHRLGEIHDAFQAAISQHGYGGKYFCVYPIKVNQQRQVVEEVLQFGKPYGFGLEAGSKPELLAVMAMTGDAPERLIICNGFKDDSYIEAVILATKLGRSIIPVIENFSELGYILRHAEKYQVRPKIGVRVNSSAVEAFTEGNILFQSLQLAPLKPSFNHLTANFADEDFEFVANSVAVYDIDHANLIGGGAGPLFAVQIAMEVGTPHVVVPPYPGIAAAMGLIATDMVYEYAATTYQRLSKLDAAALQRNRLYAN